MQNETVLQQLWQSGNAGCRKITENDFETSVASKLKNERRGLMQYYWGSFIYQLIIYSLASHVLIRHFGNLQVMAMSMALIILFIPFTYIQMRRYKAMCMHSTGSINALDQDLSKYIHAQHRLLESFYHFKTWYDRLIVPLNLLLITSLIFTVYVPGGIMGNLLAGSLIFLIILASFIVVLEKENRKKFREPLEKLKLLQHELNTKV